jgi:hypothetical protein
VHVVAGVGAGFLLAVLWFDLMFDVQVRGHGADLPADARNSIATYYRRVTTTSHPMSRLVAAFMVVTVAALVGQVAFGTTPGWAAIPSLVLVVVAVGIAAARTVRAAVRLGTQDDSPEDQNALAHRIFRDHVVCFVAITTVVILQIAA